MQIIFSNHSIIQILARGATEKEVIYTIEHGEWLNAKNNKFHSQKSFRFDNVSPVNKLWYKYKTVDAIFANENDNIVVITVKVYYHN